MAASSLKPPLRTTPKCVCVCLLGDIAAVRVEALLPDAEAHDPADILRGGPQTSALRSRCPRPCQRRERAAKGCLSQFADADSALKEPRVIADGDELHRHSDRLEDVGLTDGIRPQPLVGVWLASIGPLNARRAGECAEGDRSRANLARMPMRVSGFAFRDAPMLGGRRPPWLTAALPRKLTARPNAHLLVRPTWHLSTAGRSPGPWPVYKKLPAQLRLSCAMAGASLITHGDSAHGTHSRSACWPRGNWQDETGEVVLPATPSFLPAKDWRARPIRPHTRLDLAQWIVLEGQSGHRRAR
jgi:hypothetical protein